MLLKELLIKQSTGQTNYNRGVRFATRGLWNGSTNTFEFIDSMVSVLNLGFTAAWNDGAKSCGIKPEERTSEENNELQVQINESISFVSGFAQFINENSKANKGKLGTVLGRAALWQNRYGEIENQAKTMACGNAKYIWRLGIADHCKTCLKLNGRVMRASRWAELDVYPQDTRPGKLACHGFNCACSLNKTDLSATPGRLPRIP